MQENPVIGQQFILLSKSISSDGVLGSVGKMGMRALEGENTVFNPLFQREKDNKNCSNDLNYRLFSSLIIRESWKK